MPGHTFILSQLPYLSQASLSPPSDFFYDFWLVFKSHTGSLFHILTTFAVKLFSHSDSFLFFIQSVPCRFGLNSRLRSCLFTLLCIFLWKRQLFLELPLCKRYSSYRKFCRISTNQSSHTHWSLCSTSNSFEENSSVILKSHKVTSYSLIQNHPAFRYSTQLYSAILSLPLKTAQHNKNSEKYLSSNDL
jgi:hypothetical protein